MPDGIVKFDSGESSEMKSIHPRPQAFHMCREANPLGGRSNISQIQRIYFAKKAIVMTTMAFFWQITLTLIEFQEGVHFRRRGGAVVFGNEPPLLSFIRCQNHLPQFHPNAL